MRFLTTWKGKPLPPISALVPPPSLAHLPSEETPMYVPPLESLLRALGVDRATYERSSKIALPKEVFKFLIKIALENSEFNEAGYLKENPDVADAMKKGEISDPRAHYVGFGYFEGRTGATPTVDEKWYLETYPDVAQGVRAGTVGSAREHYNIIGGSEGRSPNASYIPVAEKWKKALVKA